MIKEAMEPADIIRGLLKLTEGYSAMSPQLAYAKPGNRQEAKSARGAAKVAAGEA